MTLHAIGHNNPPDPIDEAIAPYGDAICEAEACLDGEPVENEAQMHYVDGLAKSIKSALSDILAAKKSATAPLHDAWKSEIARWKPYEDDLGRMAKGLAALNDPFKRKLAAEKEAAKRAAYAAARAAEDEARHKAATADVADLGAQREAAEAQRQAMAAKVAASEANRDTVKGLRTVWHHEITDQTTAMIWIAGNDPDAMAEFVAGYVARNCRKTGISGVRVWSEKEAF